MWAGGQCWDGAPALLARQALLAHRNQKHLRLDFFASSFAGSFVTGDGSCLGSRMAPAAAAGELGIMSPSIWLSTRWKRPSCCRKSCSTLWASRVKGTALEGIASCGLPPTTAPHSGTRLHPCTLPQDTRGAQPPAHPQGAQSPACPQGMSPGTSAPLRSRGCCMGMACMAGDQPGFSGCCPAAGGDD